ncbi:MULTISPECIES: hypothetical protein [Vibrio]|uniref:hypothetical protein n=1 Tax=Vibrio TaxID=662 RepID=UPI00078E4F2D|nr:MULTISPECIES: hypothetical protein [Vibrio]BAU70815.1 hypothetical protein [Vibrio sp. 04Ya108]BBM67616.1 hypothetical protein VA249_42620 [Vibrio alfacsensis]BCN27099.1 hypothetical protein VYA_42910 [Vibrio alfacsensis]
MKSLEFKLDNSDMHLWVASMSKLLEVTILVKDDFIEDELCRRGDHLLYANLDEFGALGPRYQTHKPLIKNSHSEDKPMLPFYMESLGKFFQLSGVFTDVEVANQHMMSRDDVALIASSQCGLHFVASMEAAN